MRLRYVFPLIFILSATWAQEPRTGLVPLKTRAWNFICERYAYTGELTVEIARTDKGGTLKLSEKVSNPSFYIGGTVYLYLNDNTFIVCTDKAVRKNESNTATSYYTLTQNEMNRLRIATISSIRFKVNGIRGRFESQTGNFTAINKKQYFEPYDKSIRNSFETEFEINLLYSD